MGSGKHTKAAAMTEDPKFKKDGGEFQVIGGPIRAFDKKLFFEVKEILPNPVPEITPGDALLVRGYKGWFCVWRVEQQGIICFGKPVQKRYYAWQQDEYSNFILVKAMFGNDSLIEVRKLETGLHWRRNRDNG